MNENLDLVEKLKDCPKGTKLYSVISGPCILAEVSSPTAGYPILVRVYEGERYFSFTSDGRYEKGVGECLLFPSETQRDWNKFTVPIEKFDYSTLKPFDKMLVRFKDDYWRCGWFSYMNENMIYCDTGWHQGVPYNDETKHLVGTKDMPDEKYVWWK